VPTDASAEHSIERGGYVALRAPDDPDRLVRTRTAWHTLAERVVAPVRRRATGRIGLVPAPGGFGTGPLPSGPEVRVDGPDLVHGERREPVTTLGAAAGFVGLDRPGEPEVYAPLTPDDPATPLPVDAADAELLAEWFSFGATVLDEWVRATAEPPSETWLWPEHFDLALSLGAEPHRANYGASPGDGGTPEPYLYVGPWEVHPAESGEPDEFWDAGTYARLHLRDLVTVADPVGRALEFFAAGRTRA
jgi:hypothetical protein